MNKFLSGLLAVIIGIFVMVICQFLFISMEMENSTRNKLAALIGVITIRYSYKKLKKNSVEKENPN
jgi:hypothetical protein